jgi:hypothetical protein
MLDKYTHKIHRMVDLLKYIFDNVDIHIFVSQLSQTLRMLTFD